MRPGNVILVTYNSIMVAPHRNRPKTAGIPANRGYPCHGIFELRTEGRRRHAARSEEEGREGECRPGKLAGGHGAGVSRYSGGLLPRTRMLPKEKPAMRAHIDENATLHVLPETPEEALLLKLWFMAYTGRISGACVGLEIGRDAADSAPAGQSRKTP
jgi:hypothetical protein